MNIIRGQVFTFDNRIHNTFIVARMIMQRTSRHLVPIQYNTTTTFVLFISDAQPICTVVQQFLQTEYIAIIAQ